MITSTSNRSIAWIAACLLPFAATTAFAATQRTFVKSIGIDNPTCALNAPCRTFGAAIAATSPGGEVIVLDSAGYGAVTIFQSVSIIAPPGIYAGISVATGTGITVNNPNAKVILEGLTINGTGGDSGIRLPQGELHVNRCSVANMLLDGISSNPIGPARLFVHDSVIRDNGGVGIKLSKNVIAVIDGVHVVNNKNNGIEADQSTSLSVTNSEMSSNGGSGLEVSAVFATNLSPRATVGNSIVNDNFSNGIFLGASDATNVATLDVVRSTVRGNGFDGIVVSIQSGGAAYATVTESLLADHVGTGFGGSTSGALLNRNTITNNQTAGVCPGTGVTTRSNNIGVNFDQVCGGGPIPTSAGF